MSTEKCYIRLEKYIAACWPYDTLSLTESNNLSYIWISPSTAEINSDIGDILFTTGLLFERTLSINFPLLEGLNITFGTADLTTEIPISGSLLNFSDPNDVDIDVTIGPLPIVFNFQNDLLIPAQVDRSQIPPVFTRKEGEALRIEIAGVTVKGNLKGQIEFVLETGFSLAPVFIGQTGLVVEAENVSIYLSDNILPPPGMDATWRGVFLENIAIHLTEDLAKLLPDGIEMQEGYFGSGGFTGSIKLDLLAEEGVIGYDESKAKTIFGFRFTLQSLEIEFKQNTLTKSSIIGFLKVPFFDEAVEVEVGLTNDGDFMLAVSDPDGLLTLKKDGIISIEVSSLEFINEDDEFLFKLSGNVTPELAGIDWPSFELKSLSISSDGQVKVDGGWIELPEQKTLDFYGFKVEISKLGFGSDEIDRIDYKWIGFSGGIQIVQGLPLRGGVEGLKVMWDASGNPKLKIGGVYLEFEIPDVLSFDGTVYFIDEEVNGEQIKEFRGGLEVFLIPLNFGLSGQFITGKTDTYTYFYIFIEIALPVGVPLGPVVGIYGLAGLYGYNMSLDYHQLTNYKGENNRPDLTDAESSWFNQKDAMAFGVGLTVGTLPDVKFLVKAKAVFVILIPGPVLLIEGYAGMISLGENYLFRVLAAIDPTSGTFLMNISAEYQFPKDTGDLLFVTGSSEAYFSAADPDDWHLYLGQNQPESKRIRADILSFFKATTYLMVDHDGLKMGAWIGYSLNEKYGILRVIVEAWISGELELSTMPFQAKGSLTLYGNAELSAGPVSLGISVEANVTAEAPKPLYISASLEVQLKTPLGKPKAKIKLTWEKEGVPPYALPLSTTLGIEHRKVTKNWDIVKPENYGLDSDRLWDKSENLNAPIGKVPLVPPDVNLVLNFDKPVEDVGLVGDNPAPKPLNEKVGDYKFQYALKSVTLQYRDSWRNETIDDGNWEDYKAFVKSQVQNGQSTYNLSGTWQAIPDTDGIVNRKLVLNSTTPFEISRLLQNNESWLAQLNIYNPEYPCAPIDEEKWICVDFENRPYSTESPLFVEEGFIFVSDSPLSIHQYIADWLGTIKALSTSGSFQTVECLNIPLQEPTGEIKLKVIDNVSLIAGIGGNSYIKFTNEFSDKDEIECYANNLGANIPVSIHFPEVFFAGIPQKVYITCAVADPPEELFIAYDKDLNVLDTAKSKSGSDEIVTYELQSEFEPIRSIAILASTIRIIEICYVKPHSSDISNILVVMPDEMAKVEVHFSKNSQGTIYLYDKEENEIEQIGFDIPWDLPDNRVRPVELTVENQTFRSFFVSGVCQIIRVCGVTEEDNQTFQNNSGISNHLQTSVEENWGQHTAKILHPNKYYRLQVETSASRQKNNGDWTEKPFTEFMYFKTGNPPGPPSDLQRGVPENERYDLAEPLRDLSAYIDYTIPAGAAASEPQPFVYRSYDVGVVYNDSYIDQMYQMAEVPIKIRLLDNNNLPVLNADGDELELLNQWGDNPELCETREETQFKDLLDENECFVVGTEIISENTEEIIASSRALLLLPQIQYRAQVVAGESHPIYEFAFLTSRYANFLHHIHSFVDAVWNHFALLDDPAYEIDAAALEQTLTNSEDEHVKFEQLIILFDLNPRPLPDRVEVTLINDGNQSYGLLFESPEPLDWDRTEITLSFANKTNVIEEFDNKIKIVNASIEKVQSIISASDDFNQQWVDLLILATTDLSGYTIQHLPIDAPEDAEYEVFHTFTGSQVYNAGTSIRIYNGHDPGHSPNDVEHIYVYADNQSQTFQPKGEFIRIKNAEDEPLHTRLVYRKQAFDAVDISLIRNQDGTRFLAFIKNGTQAYSELQVGIYRFELTFKRDIGSEHPVWKRFGFFDPEETFAEFSLPTFIPGVVT